MYRIALASVLIFGTYTAVAAAPAAKPAARPAAKPAKVQATKVRSMGGIDEYRLPTG